MNPLTSNTPGLKIKKNHTYAYVKYIHLKYCIMYFNFVILIHLFEFVQVLEEFGFNT